jgi:hypothetical protein
VIKALNRLRYGGSVYTRMPEVITDDTEAQFLDEVIAWLESFSDVLATVSDTTTDMAAELSELRGQRKAVRDFLGLAPTTGDTP